jgi:hypothetical protein
MTATPPPPPPAAPQPAFQPPSMSPAARIRAAYMQRNESDYEFTNLGMTIFLIVITCGIFGFYVFYQLMRRMRDHNRRRLELLEATTEFAWQQATERGIAEELRPNFERVSTNLAVLRSMTTDFRDPVIWLVLAIVASGIAQYIGFIFLDGDLIKHDQNEGAVEAELSEIFGRLGQSLPAPDPSRVKGKQNYAGRIIATIASCGIYTYWWYYDQMVDVNRHFEFNWPWEDALANTVQAMAPAA